MSVSLPCDPEEDGVECRSAHLPYLLFSCSKSHFLSSVQAAWPRCRRGMVVSHSYGFDPWVGKMPWRRAWPPTPVSLPGESQGQRSLAGYSPRGCRESDTTEGLSTEAQESQRTTRWCLHTNSHYVAHVEKWIGSNSWEGGSHMPLLGLCVLN